VIQALDRLMHIERGMVQLTIGDAVMGEPQEILGVRKPFIEITLLLVPSGFRRKGLGLGEGIALRLV
jgi:hypothetical protein